MNKVAEKRDIALIIVASFCFISSSVLAFPIVAGYAESLGANSLMMGIIGGLTNASSLICRPIVGNLTERFSKFRLTMFSSVLVLIASLCYVFAPNTAVIAFARILAGIGFACSSIAMTTWLAEMLPPDKMGSGMGLYGMAISVAMAVAPALGISVYQYWGYREAFCCAVLFILTAMALLPFIKHTGQSAESITDSGATDKQKRRFELIAKRVIPIAIVMIMFGIPNMGLQTFIVRYTEVLALPVTIGLFFPFYAFMQFMFRFLLKSHFDTVPFSRFLLASSVSSAIGFIAFTFMQGNVLLLLGAICMAGGYGLIFSVAQANAALLADPGKRGIAIGTFYIGLDIALALGPVVCGYFYGHLPLSWFFPILFLFAIATPPIWWISRRIWR